MESHKSKEKMNVIKRYFHFGLTSTAVAGVYISSTTLNLTPKFNIVLESIGATFMARDAVSGQVIPASAYLQWSLENRDDPAFDRSTLYKILYMTAGQVYNEIPFYLNWPTEIQETIYFRGATESVTANNITHFLYFQLCYLCPEDYLSIEPFDISAG